MKSSTLISDMLRERLKAIPDTAISSTKGTMIVVKISHHAESSRPFDRKRYGLNEIQSSAISVVPDAEVDPDHVG